MAKEPAILYFDIETTLGVYWGYELGQQYVGYERIKKEPQVCVICYAVNDGRVQTLKFDLTKYDLDKYDDEADKEMLSKFIAITNSADLLIAHNGKFFDVAFMMGRIMKHQLPTIKPTLMDDTYLLTKFAKTQSHKLDYLLKYFGLGKKKETRGLSMWKDVGMGKKPALKEMADYCVDDVIGLRKLYKYVKPYIKSSLNLSVFYEDADKCPSCGESGTLVLHDKRRYTKSGYRRQYKCSNCGDYVTLGKSDLKKSGWYPR